MPTFSLAEAAKHCGVNRSTILRAVKSGKMSGIRN
jgi:excisionase family DNA binding protein